MLHFVYEEIDPRTNMPKYVGITVNPNARHKEHLDEDVSNTRKIAWIQELFEEGLEPEMRIIEVVKDRGMAREREKYWIQTYLEQGILLTNVADVPQIFKTSYQPLKQPARRVKKEDGEKYHLLLQKEYTRPYTITSLDYEWARYAGDDTDLAFLQAFYDMHNLYICGDHKEQEMLDMWLTIKRQELLEGEQSPTYI